jgi:hypothetical protein
MTDNKNKEERIKALYEEYEKKNSELAGNKIQLTHEDFQQENVKFVRIECAEYADLAKGLTWLVANFCDYVSDHFNSPGVFDAMLCINKRSDFDNSEEAKTLRFEIKEHQKALIEEFKLKVAEIHNEPEEDEEVREQCH